MSEHLWLHVTSGRGPAECEQAVALLVPVLTAHATAAGYRVSVLEAVAGQERGTLASALLALEGEDATAFATLWRGSIQWICPSPFRPSHKRKNWFVGVEVLAPPTGQGGLDPRDVSFETLKAGGAGGQHVNKTESAVRARHRPSGLTVLAREERSQHQNKRLALARLAAALTTAAAAEAAGAADARWEQHDALARGNPVRIFRGPDFSER